MSSIFTSTALWLRLQVFVAGFAVMALELLGSRLITPVFGSSLWTWGSLIGVVLAGLAGGYQLGGRLADRSPSRRKFSMILFLGGVLTVLVPIVAPFAVQITIFASLGDQYGPLLATTLILGPQTVVLGMTAPYAVRLASKRIDSIGNVTGGLYSVSTVGSIVGTFGTVFILIPSFDIRIVISAVGLTLMLVALPTLPKGRTVIAISLLFLMLSPTFVQATPNVADTKNGGQVVYEKQTPFSTLDVVDSYGTRILYLNGYVNSGMYLANATRLLYQYTTYFNLGMQLYPGAKEVLFVGGGGFSGPKEFLAVYPWAHVDVAEIDPDVIAAAQKYFGLKSDPRLTIFNEDARVYLGETDKKYDVVVLDAYAKTYVPFQLMTQEFFRVLSSHLSHGGIVVSNLIGSSEGETSNLVRSYYSTFSTIFNDSAIFQVDSSDSFTVQNIELVFREWQGTPLVSSILSIDRNTTTRSAQATKSGVFPIGGYAVHLLTSGVAVEGVPLLTDNYAPVESLLDPVTGKPYALEQQYGRLVLSTKVPEGQGLLTIGGGLFLGAAWLVLVSRKTDRDREREQDPTQGL